MLEKITYIFLKCLSKVLSIFPRRAIFFFGKVFGLIMYFFFPLRKAVALTNLKIAFPEKNTKSINLLIKKTYMHYGVLIFEFINQHNNTIDDSNFYLDEKTKEILKSKDGLIFMTGHHGNWEILIPIISRYKKITAIIRNQNNYGANKFFIECRKFKNVTLISKRGSKKNMFKSLKNGDMLALASDQNAKQSGTYINFFGKPASIPKGAGHFYFSTNKKIVIGFCILNKNRKYIFKLREMILKNKYEQKEDLIVEVNSIYTKILEEEIKKNPCQYFWFHKKWDIDIYKK